jgi:hypothetical protein
VQRQLRTEEGADGIVVQLGSIYSAQGEALNGRVLERVTRGCILHSRWLAAGCSAINHMRVRAHKVADVLQHAQRVQVDFVKHDGMNIVEAGGAATLLLKQVSTQALVLAARAGLVRIAVIVLVIVVVVVSTIAVVAVVTLGTLATITVVGALSKAFFAVACYRQPQQPVQSDCPEACFCKVSLELVGGRYKQRSGGVAVRGAHCGRFANARQVA